MHDGSAPGWRQTIDRHHTALVEDLTAQLDAEIASSLAQAVLDERVRAGDESRRRLSESLNQTLRRMRQTSAEHETLQLLLEDSATCSERAVVLLIENNQARIAAWRGAGLREDDMRTGQDDGESAPIDLSEAAAIASCVESRDPVVAIAAPGEISPVLASALRGTEDGKVYLFPITVRRNTVAVMMASGQVTPAPIELLCEATGMRLESFEVPVAQVTVAAAANDSLVQISGTAQQAQPIEDTAARWSTLTPAQQALHLRAQRTARVRIAQMRISESDALRKGAQAGDIYSALRTSIDGAREEFGQSYMEQSPTMVDYLHLEIMRSLAHDDSRVLGQDYPGPLK